MKHWIRALASQVERRLNPPVPLEELAGKSCLAYGFHALEHDGRRDFRWSRRFFGFYLEDAPLCEIALLINVQHESTLAISVDGTPLEVRTLSRGGQIVAFHSPRKPLPAGAQHIAFTLDRTWCAPPDPRHLGVQLLSVRVTTDRNVVWYPPAALSPNTAKISWQHCGQHFEPATKTSQPAGVNAELNIKERIGDFELVKSSPLKLYLEVAWLCNLRCPSCFHSYLDSAVRREATHFMSPHLFCRIADQLFPGAMMVWYSGNGETLLHPNAEAILQSAGDYSFVPALLTSGSLFNERNMRLLVEGGFFLSVSVDSPHPHDFERLRAGARYHKLTAALRYLIELNRSIGNPRFNLRIQCVAQQSNLHQLADLVRWAKEFEVREVQFLPLQNFGYPSDYVEQAKLQHTPDYANQRMLEAIRAGTALGIRVRPFPPFNPGPALEREFAAALTENLEASSAASELYRSLVLMAEHPANNPDRRCFLAWSECFIGADGRVAPCDMYLDVTTAGNLYDDDFWDIWNGPQMARMRRTVNHQPENLCRFGTCMFRN